MRKRAVPYDPERHDRRSIRLPAYDYRRAGGYFVTTCTQGRACLFGEVIGGQMRLNDRGRIADEEWRRTAEVRENVRLDAFVIMPNHMHGIIVIVDNDRRDTARRVPTREFGDPVSGSLPTIIGAYKSAVTKRINHLRGISGETVWQRNYYDHVIRNRDDLYRIRRYIQENPARWRRDRYYAAP